MASQDIHRTGAMRNPAAGASPEPLQHSAGRHGPNGWTTSPHTYRAASRRRDRQRLLQQRTSLEQQPAALQEPVQQLEPVQQPEPERASGLLWLEQVPCKVSFTQLLDRSDRKQFMRALLHQAEQFCGTEGCPTCKAFVKNPRRKKRPTDEEWPVKTDRATWSAENLGDLTMAELAKLRIEGCAGIKIESRLRFPISLLELRPYTPNLNWRADKDEGMWLFPEDKFELTQSSHKPVKLYLRHEAFETGTSFCTTAELMSLRQDLFKEYDSPTAAPPFVELCSSPLHCMTVPAELRKEASIPESAAFYSFCYSARKGAEKAELSARGEGQEPLPPDITEDPFVKWLTTGGFIYYDHHYDIVGINAVDFKPTPNPNEVKTSVLYFSGIDTISAESISAAQSDADKPYLDPAVVAALDDLERWWPVTYKGFKELGYDKVAWITPSEFVAGYIFTKSGGFAYRNKADHRHKSMFYPLQPKQTTSDLQNFFAGPDDRWKPEKYSAPIYIPGISDNKAAGRCSPDLEAGSTTSAERQEHHKFHHAEAHFADGEQSALGLQQFVHSAVDKLNQETAGVATEKDRDEIELQAIIKEVKEAVAGNEEDEDYKNAAYVCYGDPRDPQSDPKTQVAKVQRVEANNGLKHMAKFDEGDDIPRTSHDGWTLDDFQTGEKRVKALRQKAKELLHDSEGDAAKAEALTAEANKLETDWPAKVAKLKKAEIAALRLYTTSTFRRINNPLRNCGMENVQSKGEQLRQRAKELLRGPEGDAAKAKALTAEAKKLEMESSKSLSLPLVTHFIDTGLKKLRACHMGKGFKERHLWRGLKNKNVSDQFLLMGGTEFACMSATEDMKVMALYAQSGNPLIFRIKVESPMDMGADISWLSVFPDEKEVLYPPMTFLKPLFSQRIRGLRRGQVVTMKPSFSS